MIPSDKPKPQVQSSASVQITQEATAGDTDERSYQIFTYVRYAIIAAVGISLAVTVFIAVAAVWKTSTSVKDEQVVFPHTGYDVVENPNEFISRTTWGAQPPLYQENLTLPADLVIVTHTLTPSCYNLDHCSRLLESVQNYDFQFGRDDIADNFLIGGDGNIYEGRGWDSVNDHRNGSISVGLVGNFLYSRLMDSMVEAVVGLLRRGVESGKLSSDYRIVCYNQTTESVSPGENVYRVVKTWDHFEEGKLY